MTYEEAIKILKTFIEINGCIELPIVINAIKKAIEALEKQIPKKPKHMEEHYEHHDWYRNADGSIDDWYLDVGFHNGPMCKRCFHSFCVNCVEDYKEALNEPCDYQYWVCPNCGEKVELNAHHCICGQAIDWSGLDDK